jgi:hypothetical protein
MEHQLPGAGSGIPPKREDEAHAPDSSRPGGSPASASADGQHSESRKSTPRRPPTSRLNANLPLIQGVMANKEKMSSLEGERYLRELILGGHSAIRQVTAQGPGLARATIRNRKRVKSLRRLVEQAPEKFAAEIRQIEEQTQESHLLVCLQIGFLLTQRREGSGPTPPLTVRPLAPASEALEQSPTPAPPPDKHSPGPKARDPVFEALIKEWGHIVPK